MKVYKMISQSIFTLLVLLFMCNVSLYAQDEEPSKTFHFVYIAQGGYEEMPVESLKKNLEAAWTSTMNGPVIIYLSRGIEEPVILKANIDEDFDPEQARQIFENKILDRLNDGVYSVDGNYDKNNILKLLKENDFIDQNGQPKYVETIFDFHVGQDYWDSQCNESVLASLFFELNIAKYMEQNKGFHFNVFCSRTAKFNQESAFGSLNPDDCLKYINLDRSKY